MGEASLECLGFFACHFYPTSGKTEARGDPWVGTGPRRAEKRGSQPSLAPAGPGWEEAGSVGQRDHFAGLHLQVRDQGNGLLWLPVCLSKENTSRNALEGTAF